MFFFACVVALGVKFTIKIEKEKQLDVCILMINILIALLLWYFECPFCGTYYPK